MTRLFRAASSIVPLGIATALGLSACGNTFANHLPAFLKPAELASPAPKAMTQATPASAPSAVAQAVAAPQPSEQQSVPAAGIRPAAIEERQAGSATAAKPDSGTSEHEIASISSAGMTGGDAASSATSSLGASSSRSSAEDSAALDRVVASVDGEPITGRDVEAFSSAVGRPVKASDLADNDTAKAVLKALISQKLLDKEVEKYSDKVEESQVDRYMAEVRQDRHMTEDQFKAALASSGMTMDEYRKHARQELEKAMMIQEQVREKIDISDSEIQAYYDQHKAEFMIDKERLKLAQILVGVPANATPQQVAALKAKAEKIRKVAAGGADFAALAHKYSDDSSRNNGGELGWFEPSDVMDQILTGVKNLKPGDVSQVVRTSHGFHILKLEEHEMAGPRPLVDVKGKIREKLTDERANAEMEKWVETDLVQKHDVETLY